jgi:glycosyltransferase involved in cell wall biosynthesis
MKVSIVIACRNEASVIQPFLESVLLQDTTGHEVEIIVADGESDDGTAELVLRYSDKDSRIRVIRNVGKIVSTGLNAAIRAARGEVIIRMDAHTEYAADYMQRCIETLTRTGAWNVGGPARTKASGFVGRAIAAAYHSRFSTGGARFHDETYEGSVDTVTYGCWWKSTLERVGLFDESLVRNQDDELNLRIIRAGGVIWQSPSIVSWYQPRNSLRSLFRQYFQYGYWKVAVIRKHKVPASWRHLVPGAFVMLNAALLVMLLVALVMESRALLRASETGFAAVVVAYGAGVLTATMSAARAAGFASTLILPLVFAIYHVSYGLGFIVGLGDTSRGAAQPSSGAPRFSSLSR